MKIAIAKERRPHERRVAATPDTIKRYLQWGFDVTVESGAGEGASISDAAFADAGATVAASRSEALSGSDIVLKVQRPLTESEGDDGLADVPDGAILIGLQNPYGDPGGVEAYAKRNITAFSMEMLPRISRAQSMDVLSSQSNLTGYKAVIDGAANYGRGMPMLMTAAGRINPAKVFVMGAGVAGLQAISIAKKLGAVVEANDIRPAVKEQVESLGGKFVDTGSPPDAETSGGYAKEAGEEFLKQQREILTKHISGADVLITTALVPGKKAPVLVTADMRRAMAPGSVIIDMAAGQGGNVEGSESGQTVVVDGVTIVGETNLPAQVANDASRMYARNVFAFLGEFIDKEGAMTFDVEGEILGAVSIVHDGAVRHEPTAKALES